MKTAVSAEVDIGLTNTGSTAQLTIPSAVNASGNFLSYNAFQIDELHRHNQNLVGMLHKGVPTVVYRHENCCKTRNSQRYLLPRE